MRHELTIVKTITVGCHLRRGDLEERLQKGLRFKLRESQRLNLIITMKYDDRNTSLMMTLMITMIRSFE